MNVRLATVGDLEGIRAISNRAIAETTANFNTSPQSLESWREKWESTRELHPFLVAVDEGAVIGFAHSSRHRVRSAYDWTVEVAVYVNPERHGRGVGRALYTELLATLREQGYRSALAGIALPNPASVALHESLGFRRVGMFEDVGRKFGTWLPVGYWQLTFSEEDAEPGPILPVANVRRG